VRLDTIVKPPRERLVDLNDDKDLDICQNIEVGLKSQYEQHLELTDSLCIFALENAKIAIRKQFGYAKNEKVTTHPLTKGIIDWCVAVGIARIGKDQGLTLPEYIARIEKLRRSVKLHSEYGTRGYYDFIRDFV
jgi:hypothetical protein